MSQDEARALICCAILTVHHEGQRYDMSFGISKSKAEYARQVLVKDWGINDWGTSLTILENFSKATADNPIITEIFENVIAKSQYEVVRSIFAPLKQDALLGLDLRRNFGHLWEAVTNNANNDIDVFLNYLNGKDEASKMFHNITASLLLNRINGGIAGYEQAIRTLILYGYSMEELSKIDNFCAWDIGRAGYLAKLAVAAGFIDEATSRQYMLAAGKLAYTTYLDWRQFLAAYFIGQGIMGGKAKDIGDFGDTIQYLIKNKKSPYQKFPLKSA